MNVFLSYSFREEDKELVARVRETLEDFGFKAVTGKHLGGEQLEAEIKRCIEAVDALVAVLTLRPKAKRDESMLDWVKWELKEARDQNKLAIVMIEEGVPLKGPETGHEYVVFTRERMDSALLDLMKKAVVWRGRAGRRIKVQLLPPELAAKFRYDEQSLQCWMRCFRDGKREDWRRIERVVYEDKGAFAYIDVPEEQSFQVKVVEPSGASHKVWISPTLPGNHLPVTLDV